MKKILAMLLLCAFTFGGIGCSGDKKDDKKTDTKTTTTTDTKTTTTTDTKTTTKTP